MAKDKKTNGQKDECTRVRSSFGLPPEWMHVLQHLSTSRQKDFGELIQGWAEREFAGLPRAEAEAIRTLVRLATGRTLRLTSTTGTGATESADAGAGQGSGSSTPANGSEMLAQRIIDTQNRTVDAPIVAALSGLYGEG